MTWKIYLLLPLLLLLSSCDTQVKPPTPSSSPSEAGIGLDLEPVPTVALDCATYHWNERGQGPAGYFQGLALVKADVLKRGSAAIGAPLGNPTKDSLAHYKAQFEALGIPLVTEQDRIKATFLLLHGLGMRESSGNWSEGWDTSASTHTESGAEAGLFQVSYDSLGSNASLQSALNFYKQDLNRCLLEVFRIGAPEKTGKNQKVIGSGNGANFQRFQKACPAGAAEYAAIVLRINGGAEGHFGPIRRHEVELLKACY